ncbi:hypothetical protein OEZ86_001047 [Tetradesmus obliquus]|nr:hypothetical protein OEZ86_001047 [Tetradesmus obliquus]
MLSGGQQALATLALSFALQALFPSPFCFFDEVDCALDSLAALTPYFDVLSVHLQALFPSPFYFFDEVDCALDSLAAGRVAAFVRAQCSGSRSNSKDSHTDSLSKGAELLADSKPGGSVDADSPEAACEGTECSPRVAAKSGAAAVHAANVSGSRDGAPSIKAADESSSAGGAACMAASRVGAQYLLVSHRPVVFESASCLLGVYSNGRGSSAAVVAHF